MIVAALALAAAGPGGAPIQLALPIACEVGRTCFVQQYADHDPGPGAVDFRCSTLTYDGHDGTDIRLPTLRAQAAGVSVLAAAAGVVKGVRDGEPDQLVTPQTPAAKGRECGNGVLIGHPGGWETQYCHMARGSILVRPGQSVSVGAPLGRVGLSGDTQFPHVHLSVRQNGRKVDPFAWREGKAIGACGGGRSLWTEAAGRALAWRSPEVTVLGLTGAAPGPGSAITEAPPVAPDANAPSIIAFVRAIKLQAGDVQSLSLVGPTGVLAEDARPALERSRAEQTLFVGRRRPAAGWPPGAYTARFTVTRAGKVALTRTAAVRF